MNELYVIVFRGKRTMLGRRAYRTRAEAEAYIADDKHRAERYEIERYVPAPLEQA